MGNFTKTLEKLFSGPSIKPKQRCFTEVDYFNQIQKSVSTKGKVGDSKNGFVPEVENFIKTFYLCTFPRIKTTGNVLWFAYSEFMLLNKTAVKIYNTGQTY